jgi:hypothetical protein
MKSFVKKCTPTKYPWHTTTAMHIVNILLLLMIIVGIFLLYNQDRWVPDLVQYILRNDAVQQATMTPY